MLILCNMLILDAHDQSSIVLIADPKVLAISIKENDEPLVDLKNQNVILLGPSPEIPNNIDYTKMRKSVYDKLVKAQGMLPKGLRFRLYEGYRSLSLQEKIFNERYAKVKAQNPSWQHEELFLETTKLVSPVINLDGSRNIPPHSTGGAIDVYLVDEKYQPVDMGIHPGDWMQDLDASLSQTDSLKISKEARKNRAIMSEVLTKVGFINYPTEYWHWSYGDRYWAYHKKESHALYGSVKS
jgi:zinc D-Ala-D-Ala dipeptidase